MLPSFYSQVQGRGFANPSLWVANSVGDGSTNIGVEVWCHLKPSYMAIEKDPSSGVAPFTHLPKSSKAIFPRGPHSVEVRYLRRAALTFAYDQVFSPQDTARDIVGAMQVTKSSFVLACH